jgi:2,3-bisphosphoglycerate-independent phosphoglycerate mutase
MPSETAHFRIFGYGLEEFPGRGYVEARGFDIPLGDNDVSILCHLCHCDEDRGTLRIRSHRPSLTREETDELARSIGFEAGDKISIRFVPSRGSDGFLVLSGPVSKAVSDSDPILENRPVQRVHPLDESEAARRTARALNGYMLRAHRILADHPVNERRRARGAPPATALVFQRPGRRVPLEPFRERWGLSALSISSGPGYWGLCGELGMDVERAMDTGDPEQDLLDRLQRAREDSSHELIHVHTKAPDDAGHSRDPLQKRDVIEALDRAMGFALRTMANDPEILLVVTADHATNSVGTMIHSGETVPLLMTGRYPRRDHVKAYNEVDCASGALGIVRGTELMHLVLNFLDRGKLKGLMDTPVDRPYFPSRSEPLTLEGE